MAEIVAGVAARQLLSRSLAPMLRAVAASLGPHGRPCLCDMGSGAPREALTGAAIAGAIADEAGPWSVGPRILRETLHDAERELGDGTARLAVMAGAMVGRGLRAIASGVPPNRLADALLALAAPLAAALAARSQPLERLDPAALGRIALSAGAPPDVIASLIEAVAAIGPDGALDVVSGPTSGVCLRTDAGFVFDGVAIVGDDAGAYEPAHVLVADDVIAHFGSLAPILEGFAQRGKALVVAARDVRGEALAALHRNLRDNGLRVTALKPEAVAQQAADVLEDLAVATGAALVAERFGTSMHQLRPGMLGRAAVFRFDGREAVFAAPAGDQKEAAFRARLLLAEAERAKYLALDRERLLRRSARLQGRWAELAVGGASERETEVRRAATRAAAASLRSAYQSGVVAGGGDVLAAVADDLMAAATDAILTPRGAALACAAAGLRQVRIEIERNAGSPRPATGIGPGGAADAPDRPLDPLATTRAIVERALSCAGALLRSEALICA